MNCLNRPEIQEYIDNELSSKKGEEVNKHLQGCKKCSSLYQQALKEKENLHNVFAIIDRFPEHISSPRVLSKKKKIRTSKRLTPLLFLKIAAGILIIIGLFTIITRKPTSDHLNSEIDIAIMELINGTDPNKLWIEKQMVIVITDKNGKVIHSMLIGNSDYN
ncbi:hypothetical protein ES705_25983 [subsurface metagenome]